MEMEVDINKYLGEEDEEQEKKEVITLDQDEQEYGKRYKISDSTMKEMKKYFINITTEKEKKEDFEYESWISRFEENPYLFMNVDGYGFKRCDNLAKRIGYDMESPNRVLAYVNMAIEQNSNGSTIVKFIDIIGIIKKDLLINDIKKIMKILMSRKGKFSLLDYQCKRLTIQEINNIKRVPEYITTNDWYYAEKFCYEWLKYLSKLPKTEEDINITENILSNNNTLNSKQKEIIENIINKNVNVIIGKSGSGKSYVTKQVLNILDSYGFSYCLLTPTGIASVNLKEKTGRKVETIHRRYFKKNKKGNRIPIKEDYVVIDEIGMVGADHFKMLRALIPYKDKKIIFIGDNNQLPSISAGDFLTNIIKLIKSGKVDGNIFELTEIMRASSETFVPYLCNMFCGDSKFNKDVLDTEMKSVLFVEREKDLSEQIERIVKTNNWNWLETAVIMPQRVGDYGCNVVNSYFQEQNKSEILYSDKYKCFKRNDKLMHIKNNPILNIYNGEWVEMIGVEYGETEEDNAYLVKRLGTETNEENVMYYSYEEASTELMLAYAVTVHKCQGSTIKNVIFVAIPEHQYMLTRELTYTGISRTSDHIIIIGDKKALETSSYRKVSNKRKTFLGLICESM